MSVAWEKSPLARSTQATPISPGRLNSEATLDLILPAGPRGSPRSAKPNTIPVIMPQEHVPKRKFSVIELDDSDDSLAEAPKTSSALCTGVKSSATLKDAKDRKPDPATRVAPMAEQHGRAGRSLRRPLAAKASDIGYIMPNKRPRKNNARTAGRKTGTAVDADRAFSQTRKATAELTSRQAVRHAIATEIAAARAVFFKAKKDYFLPLLPQTNFIQKLVDKPGLQNRREENQASTRGEALAHSDGTDGEIHPYADIEDQPKGWVFTASVTRKTAFRSADLSFDQDHGNDEAIPAGRPFFLDLSAQERPLGHPWRRDGSWKDAADAVAVPASQRERSSFTVAWRETAIPGRLSLERVELMDG